MSVSPNKPPFHNFESIRQAATSAAQDPTKLKNLKELSQEERKLLLDIIKDTPSIQASEASENIYTKLAKNDSFQRNNSFAASISRFFKNIFFDRTSSKDLIDAILEPKNISFSKKDIDDLKEFLSKQYPADWREGTDNGMIAQINGKGQITLDWPGEVINSSQKTITIQVPKSVAYAKMKDLEECGPYEETDVLQYIFKKLPRDTCFLVNQDEDDDNCELRSNQEDTLKTALKQTFPDFDGYQIVRVASDEESNSQNLIAYKLEILPDAVKTFHTLHCIQKDMFDDMNAS